METKTEFIFHLAFKEEWDAAANSGSYVPSHYATDGFIHCSTAAQLKESAQRHFPNSYQLYVLVLNPDQLGDALKWEASRNGDLFPHIYRSLDMDKEVVQTIQIQRNAEGNWEGWESLA